VEKIIVYTHSDCLAKDNGLNHPERKERLETVLESVKELDRLDIDIKDAPLATPETINLVHPQSHLNAIFSMIPVPVLLVLRRNHMPTHSYVSTARMQY